MGRIEMGETPEILIPAIMLLSIYVFYQRRNSGNFGAVSYMIAIYSGLCILSAFARITGAIKGTFAINIIPVLYLSLCLGITLWGFFLYRDNRLLTIRIENYRLFRILEMVLLLTSILAIFLFLPTAVSALHGDIADNRINIGEIGESLEQLGYINTFFSLIANMFALNIIIAFLNLTPELIRLPHSTMKAVLLLMSSSVYIVYVLAMVGRDGVVFWIMTFIFLFLIFRKFVRGDWAFKLKSFAITFSALSLIPFSMITYARFVDYKDGLFAGLWMYVGDQVSAFNDLFMSLSSPQMGRINFPLLYRLFDPSYSKLDRHDWHYLYTQQGVIPWSFPTFVGSFILDFGYIVTPLLILLIAMGARLSLRGLYKTGSITLSQLLIFLLCAQMVLYGVFYFRQSSVNLYIFAVLALALLLKVTGLKSRSVYISRQARR